MAYSFKDLAEEVLKTVPRPLTYQEIWQLAQDQRLTGKVSSKGKTPTSTLGAQLYVDANKPDSVFLKVGKRPVRFFLRERSSELSIGVIRTAEIEASKKEEKVEKATRYLERDLHPLLTYFAYAAPGFNRGRSVITKTIHHEKSLKSGYSEWVYPDLVGFYLPLEDDWHKSVIEFNRILDVNSLRLFSFELKRVLNRSNYREAFFQAVSNSSWAHEGYLVTASVADDDELLAELDRLAAAFGIGIIHLDLSDITSSKILYPARTRDSLDWDAINKLCEQKEEFVC